MSEKIDSILSKLRNDDPGRDIQYRHTDGFHKFRIEGDGPTHWLYFSDEAIDDADTDVLINKINIYSILEIITSSRKSRWLFISNDQFIEVDENFTKPI